MSALGIRVVNAAEGKHIALGNNTRVFALIRNDDGEIEEIDISNAVRSVNAKLEVGSVVTATMEVFLTGFESRAEVEEIIVRKIKRRRFWQRWRDITSFGSRDGVREYVGTWNS